MMPVPLEENTALYDKFLEEIGEEEPSPNFFALSTNFKGKVNTDRLFVVERINTEVGASGKETVNYDNIDLNNQIIITLPSLFKDNSYIEAISNNIRTQMQKQISKAEGIIYFIGESEGGFVKIDSEQAFYINADSKLVIVFDEYEVASRSRLFYNRLGGYSMSDKSGSERIEQIAGNCLECRNSGKNRFWRNEKTVKQLVTRLNRIEGQIRGIRKMIEEGVYCDDILNQISSVQSATCGVARLLLEKHMKFCIKDQLLEGDEQVLDEVLKTLFKMIR